MKNFSWLAVTVLSSSIGFAAPKIECSVISLTDAESCMRLVATATSKNVKPNEGYATDVVSKLTTALQLTKGNDQSMQTAKSADYAGIVIEQSDESRVRYFVVSKGSHVTPLEIHSFYLADLWPDVMGPQGELAAKPSTYFLDIESSNGAAWLEMTDYIKDAQAEADQIAKNKAKKPQRIVAINIDCKRPSQFAGTSITVSGTLSLGNLLPTAAYQMSGVLQTSIKAKEATMAVWGTYDFINEMAYVEAKGKSEARNIHIRMNNKDPHAVSMMILKNGDQEPLSCRVDEVKEPAQN